MQITFLGTGTSQGVPIIACSCKTCISVDTKDKRLRSSILIEDNQHAFVIDSGPDFRQQMLRENVKKIDAVIFTHEHKDHVAGLDDIRAFNYILQKPIDVYGSANVLAGLKREFSYIFNGDNYPGIPEIIFHLIDKHTIFKIADTEFIPIEAIHYKLPVLGYRIKDFTYITDANFISEEEKQKIRGSKVLVLNALRQTQHISHFTLQEAIALIEELQPEQAYLTHISHQMGTHAEVSKLLPPNVQLAFDGLKITL